MRFSNYYDCPDWIWLRPRFCETPPQLCFSNRTTVFSRTYFAISMVGNRIENKGKLVNCVTDRSLRASFFKSEKSGIEFLNSFIFSSRIWQSGRALTSRGNLLSCFIKPSMPSDNTDTSRLAHSVLAHSSRAACWVRGNQLVSRQVLHLGDIVRSHARATRERRRVFARLHSLRTRNEELAQRPKINCQLHFGP